MLRRSFTTMLPFFTCHVYGQDKAIQETMKMEIKDGMMNVIDGVTYSRVFSRNGVRQLKMTVISCREYLNRNRQSLCRDNEIKERLNVIAC